MLRIQLICIGDKLPLWMHHGIAAYSKRLTPFCHFDIIELKHIKRNRSQDATQCIAVEGTRMLQRIAPQSCIIALDQRGSSWCTEVLAQQLLQWQQQAQSLSFLIGGADGLAPSCRNKAQHTWSLSKLTLPHGLARLLVVEQCYRAFSYLAGHPYHR